MKYWNCINDCGDQESFSKEWLLAHFPDTNPRLGWAGEAPAARSHCGVKPAYTHTQLWLHLRQFNSSWHFPGTFLLSSWLKWSHMPAYATEGAEFCGASGRYPIFIDSPSTPSFSASFTIWSVSSLLKQPSSLVMCILFFLPAFLSAAGTLRMVLVTLSKVTWMSGTPQ